MNPNSIFQVVKPDKADLARGRSLQQKRLKETPTENNKTLIQKMMANARKISGESVKTRLQSLLVRAEHCCNPANAACSKEFLTAALSALDTDDHKKSVSAMVAAAQAGDESQKVELGRMIAVNVGKLIRSAGTWIQWYQSQTLADGDMPYLRNFVPQTIDVKVGTGDGYITTKHAVPNREDDTLVELFFLLSDMFVAKMFDPYKGSIADAALGTVDISLDLAEKIDGLLQLPFVVGSANSVFTSSFTVDGTPASHYHASSRINTANFPTGNIIAPTSNGASTTPRLDVIRAVDEYFGRFGDSIDGMGAATINVASGIAHTFGSEFSASAAVNRWTDNLFGNRSALNYNGRTYVIVPDPTIDPTDKYVYVKGVQPAGIYFDKPAGALVHREERVIENEVLTFERALIGYAFPVTWIPRVLAVKFKS